MSIVTQESEVELSSILSDYKHVQYHASIISCKSASCSSIGHFKHCIACLVTCHCKAYGDLTHPYPQSPGMCRSCYPSSSGQSGRRTHWRTRSSTVRSNSVVSLFTSLYRGWSMSRLPHLCKGGGGDMNKPT